jgi:hypothetical protein
MIDPQSIFSLVAELALGLAGFAGVAAAFGGRDRSYAPIENFRLQSLFIHAFLALALSLVTISLLALGFAHSDAYLFASIAGAISQGPVTALFIYRVFVALRDPGSVTGRGAVAATVLGTSLSLGLFVASALSPETPGYLALALSAQLLFGLWVFTRILLHRN